MYDAFDPRAAFAAATMPARVAAEFAEAEIGRFHQEQPQEDVPEGKTRYVRGRNFLAAYTKAAPGAVLSRRGQLDEYVVLLARPDTRVGEQGACPAWSTR